MKRALYARVSKSDKGQDVGMQVREFQEFCEKRNWTVADHPNGRLIFGIMASIAEFERELIRDRARSGVQHTRSKGKRLGRPRVHVDAAQIAGLRRQNRSCAVRHPYLEKSATEPPERPLDRNLPCGCDDWNLFAVQPACRCARFTPLPARYFAFFVVATGAYLLLVEAAKRRLLNRATEKHESKGEMQW